MFNQLGFDGGTVRTPVMDLWLNCLIVSDVTEVFAETKARTWKEVETEQKGDDEDQDCKTKQRVSCVGGEIVSFCPVSGDAPTFLDVDQDSFRRWNTSVAFTTLPAVGIPLLTIKLNTQLLSARAIFSCMDAHSMHVYLHISCVLYMGVKEIFAHG